MPSLIGRTLGRYRLDASLGHGGMAEVYRAVDGQLGRAVAVKVVHPDLARDSEFRQRFLREARLVAALTHPNIVPIYDFGEEAGLPYLVMPLFDGGSLGERLDGRPVEPRRALRLLAELGLALDAAHRAGVLHRDLKPSNVLFDRQDRALLADFGIALAAGAATRLTTTGSVVGTPGYMAPEVAQGEPASPASDRYAFAVLAFELLTGSTPFAGDTPLAVLNQHATRPAPAPSERLAGAPPELDRIFAAALAKRPEERPATATEVVLAAARAFGIEEPGLRAVDQLPPASWPTPAAGMRRRSSSTAMTAIRPPLNRSQRFLAVSAGVALLLGSAAVGAWGWKVLMGPEVEEEGTTGTAGTAGTMGPIETGVEQSMVPKAEPPPAPVREVVREVAAAPSRAPAPAPPPPADEVVADEAVAQEPLPQEEPQKPGLEMRRFGRRPGAKLGGREPNGVRTGLDWMRFPRPLSAADFAQLQEWTPLDSRSAPAMGAYSRGGIAYASGNDAGARAALVEVTQAGGAPPLLLGFGPLWVMRGAAGELRPWELATAYGDARGEGLAAVEAELAADPGSCRVRFGRAYLRRLHSQHQAALDDALACAEAEPPIDRGAFAGFIAQEMAKLGRRDEALAWYRKSLTAGGRAGAALAMEAARFAIEELRDRAVALEFTEAACRAGSPQACRRAKIMRTGR